MLQRVAAVQRRCRRRTHEAEAAADEEADDETDDQHHHRSDRNSSGPTSRTAPAIRPAMPVPTFMAAGLQRNHRWCFRGNARPTAIRKSS